jgi:hypothetical protein
MRIIVLRFACTCNFGFRRQTASIAAVTKFMCFKVTVKSYNFATRTSEPRRVKTAQNSQHSKANNAVLVT